jgi:hypothetical protein
LATVVAVCTVVVVSTVAVVTGSEVAAGVSSVCCAPVQAVRTTAKPISQEVVGLRALISASPLDQHLGLVMTSAIRVGDDAENVWNGDREIHKNRSKPLVGPLLTIP